MNDKEYEVLSEVIKDLGETDCAMFLYRKAVEELFSTMETEISSNLKLLKDIKDKINSNIDGLYELSRKLSELHMYDHDTPMGVSGAVQREIINIKGIMEEESLIRTTNKAVEELKNLNETFELPEVKPQKVVINSEELIKGLKDDLLNYGFIEKRQDHFALGNDKTDDFVFEIQKTSDNKYFISGMCLVYAKRFERGRVGFIETRKLSDDLMKIYEQSGDEITKEIKTSIGGDYDCVKYMAGGKTIMELRRSSDEEGVDAFMLNSFVLSEQDCFDLFKTYCRKMSNESEKWLESSIGPSIMLLKAPATAKGVEW